MKKIHTKKKEEEAQSVIQAKSKKKKVLAVECMKAFEEAGLKNSDLLQVQRAVKLCSSYIPQSSHVGEKSSSSITALWKSELPCTSKQDNDPKDLAASVLGKELVATVTQEGQQPPDVRKCKQLISADMCM